MIFWEISRLSSCAAAESLGLMLLWPMSTTMSTISIATQMLTSTAVSMSTATKRQPRLA